MVTTDRNECVFCEIVTGSLEASIVFEDNVCMAFMDLQPVTSGHVLVVPKPHAADLEALQEDIGAHLFRIAHRLARALRRTELRCDGVNLFIADGETAGQDVFHVHLHVFPRFPGDGFQLEADWRIRPRSELDAAAQQLRRGLATLTHL